MNRILQVNVDQIDYGGVYALVMSLYGEIRKNTDIQFDFCAFEKFKNPKEIEKIEAMGGRVYYLGYEGNKIIRQFVHFYRYRKFLKEHHYDTIHAHGDLAFKLFIYSFGAKCEHVRKIIVHSHSSGVDGSHRKLKKIAHIFFRPLLSHTATDYLACSEKAGEWMYAQKIRDRVRIVKNGIDVSRYRFDENLRTRFRKENKLENKFVIGQIGGFRYVKNHEFSVSLLKELEKINSDTVMVFVGKGELEEHIRTLAKEHGLEEKIIFWGGSDEVEKILQMLDAVIMPSYFEGMPMVAIEAQAAGVPVILSDSITREVKASDNVYFESIDDMEIWQKRLMQIREDGDLSKRNQGVDKLEQMGFDIRQAAKQIVELYKYV